MDTIDRSTMEGKLLPELQQIVQTMGIEGSQRLRKAGLIDAIVEASSNGERPGNGEARAASSRERAVATDAVEIGAVTTAAPPLPLRAILAYWDQPDDERPLTEDGKKEVAAVARLLSRLEISPVILTSPLPRASQTAAWAAEFPPPITPTRVASQRCASGGPAA